MNHYLSDAEFTSVCRVIESRIGLNFPGERRSLLSSGLTHAAAAFNFDELSEFIKWLNATTLRKDQAEVLASYITISETYFWREPNVFDALTNSIIPGLISLKRNNKKIRIWSVGCSTGEEPYSLAIALHKTIPDIAEWDIQVLATDISPKVIERGKAGLYGPWSFRNSPAWLKSSYFNIHEERKYEIIPEIKKLVSFSVLNLANMPYSGIANGMDIIFCRNVLMYFTDDWIKMISDKLFQKLSENGWFVVASCELGTTRFSQYETVQFPGAILYRKSKKESNANHYGEAELGSIPARVPEFRSSFLGNHVSPTTSPETVSEPEITISVQESKGEENSLSAYRTMIQSIAGGGQLEEALTVCNTAIESFKLASDLYLLKASILLELEKSPEAAESLRKAIYINPDNIMGHFALGRLFISFGNTKGARRYFQNVIVLIEKYDDDYILPESEGISVMQIREIVKKNLQTLEN